MRGHWTTGKRRHAMDADRFIAALCREFSARELGRLAGVSDRTIRRWRDGVDRPRPARLHEMIDRLFPANGGALPIYSPEMAIDGNTRMGGVGEYSRRAAQGDMEYIGSGT